MGDKGPTWVELVGWDMGCEISIDFLDWVYLGGLVDFCNAGQGMTLVITDADDAVQYHQGSQTLRGFFGSPKMSKATKWACNATAPGNATVLILTPRRRILKGDQVLHVPIWVPISMPHNAAERPTVLPTLVRYFVLVPGAINLVQSPSYFDKLLDMGCPSHSLFLAGHWVSSDLCINAVPDSKDGHSSWSKVDVVVLQFLLLRTKPVSSNCVVDHHILHTRITTGSVSYLSPRASAQS